LQESEKHLQKQTFESSRSPRNVSPIDDNIPESVALHETDLGNAQRLIHHHGQDLRYVHSWGKWIVWNGTCWEQDRDGEVRRRAYQTVASIYAEAQHLSEQEARKRRANWATRSESERGLSAMISEARNLAGVSVDVKALDSDPWLLNVGNGTINLKSGQLQQHRREDMITKIVPVEFDPDATCPHWDAFLERVIPDKDVRDFVQRAIGYSLTGDTSERVLFILLGEGRNGKSTFLETIKALLGDYAKQTPMETLMVKPSCSIPHDIARLVGARFVSASEAEDGQRLAESLIKALTGGDTISARHLYTEYFEFKPQFKLWLGTNHKPGIRGTDKAIWDRIRLIPFNERITDEQVIPQRVMRASLAPEQAGILAWAIRGCQAYLQQGLGNPGAVKAAGAAYREEMDLLGDFLATRCIESASGKVQSSDLFAAYKAYCEETGDQPLNQTSFSLKIVERGFRKTRTKQGWIWEGLSIRSSRQEEKPDDGVGLPESVGLCRDSQVFSDKSTSREEDSEKPYTTLHPTPRLQIIGDDAGSTDTTRPPLMPHQFIDEHTELKPGDHIGDISGAWSLVVTEIEGENVFAYYLNDSGPEQADLYPRESLNGLLLLRRAA
jgi:putative DNA primase/helicase